MANFIYDKWRLNAGDGNTKIDLSTGGDTIKVALATSSYTPNEATHEFFDDLTNEVVGTGYTAGGDTLASQDWTVAANVAKFDATDTTWTTSTITARYAIIYKSTGTASTSPLIGLIDFTTNRVSDGGTFQIAWNAIGIITLT